MRVPVCLLQSFILFTLPATSAVAIEVNNGHESSLSRVSAQPPTKVSPPGTTNAQHEYSPAIKRLFELLQSVADREMNSHDLNQIYYGSHECSDLLMPCINLDAKFISNNSDLEIYPLHSLLNNSKYKSIVGKLINSPHPYNQALGFIVAASAEDRTYVDKMLAALRKDEDYPLRTYGAAALLYLKHPDSQLLFKYLINHQNIEDLDLWSTYLWQGESALNAIPLEQLASTDPTACITALALHAPMQGKKAPLPGCEAEFKESLKHLNYPLTDQYIDTRLYIKPKGDALYVNTNWNGLNIYKGHQLLLKDCHDFNDLAMQATPVYYIDKTPQEKKARLYASMSVFIHESFFHDKRWQDFDFGPLTKAVLIKNGKAQPIARDSIKTKMWKKTSTAQDDNLNQVD